MINPFPDPLGGRNLDSVEFERVQWLLPKILAPGHITALAAPPSSGGTPLIAYFVARLTTGSAVTGYAETPPATVTLWPSTPHVGIMIKRMVVAAGGDESKVKLIGDGLPYDPVRDLPLVQSHLMDAQNASVALLIDKVRDEIRNRENLEQCWRDLAATCHQTQNAVMVVCNSRRHRPRAIVERTKDAGLTRAASLVLSLAEDMDRTSEAVTRHAVARCKASICDRYGGYDFSIGSVSVAGVDTPVVMHLTPVAGTAEDIFAAIEEPAGKRARDAIAWLRSRVPEGGIWVQDLQRLAREDGMSFRTARRVYARAGVDIRVHAGRSIWCLVNGNCLSGFSTGDNRAGDLWSSARPSGPLQWPTNSPGWKWGAPDDFKLVGEPRSQSGKAGQRGFARQGGQVDQGVPAEAEILHPDHLRYKELCARAEDVMDNSTFDDTTADPKRAVVQSVIDERVPQWRSREDIIVSIMGTLATSW